MDARVVAPVATEATMLVLRPSGGHQGGLRRRVDLRDRSRRGARGRGNRRRRPRRGATRSSSRTPTTRSSGSTSSPRPRGRGALDGTAPRWNRQPRHRGARLRRRDARRTRAGRARNHGLAGGARRRRRGARARHARGARWGREGAPRSAEKQLHRLADARRRGAPAGGAKTIAASGLMLGDVDAVRAGDRVLVAWTDASQPDPQPMLASIDAAGAVAGPKRAVSGGFGGMLVALAAGPAGAVLAWEEPARRGRSSKRVTLGKVDRRRPRLTRRAKSPSICKGMARRRLPGLADGFALLAPARACTANETCDDPTALPTFVRMDAKLRRSRRWSRSGIGVLRDRASTGWSLACDPASAAASCLALAAATPKDDPQLHFYSVDLPKRETTFRAPVAPPPPRDAPRRSTPSTPSPRASPSSTWPRRTSAAAASSPRSRPRTTKRPSTTTTRPSRSRSSTHQARAAPAPSR